MFRGPSSKLSALNSEAVSNINNLIVLKNLSLLSGIRVDVPGLAAALCSDVSVITSKFLPENGPESPQEEM